MDELVGGKTDNADSAKPNESVQAGGRIGTGLCILGAVCLIVFGILMVVQPSAADKVSESSMITLNGSGILVILFVSLMAIGIFLIFRKR